ncbi:MAG TPA: hypothetical protein VFS49_11250 [Croceibacterium sp.]|nr:hypothetical protein [Croceibacterium sp.]
MSRGDYYFSRGLVKGFGKVFFLKILQEAPEGSAPRRLLGSFVDEIDYGLFSSRCAPGLEHAWDPEYFLKTARRLPGWEDRELVLETSLAGFSQDYEIKTKAGVDAKASFPGAPVSAGIEVDYQRLRKARVTMGAGSKKLYIPQNFVPAAYGHFVRDPGSFDPILFDDDIMLVDQLVIVTDLTVEVESKVDFSADFDAKAAGVSGLDGGIAYSRQSARTYQLRVNDGKEYLFALGAVEADKFAEREL